MSPYADPGMTLHVLHWLPEDCPTGIRWQLVVPSYRAMETFGVEVRRLRPKLLTSSLEEAVALDREAVAWADVVVWPADSGSFWPRHTCLDCAWHSWERLAAEEDEAAQQHQAIGHRTRPVNADFDVVWPLVEKTKPIVVDFDDLITEPMPSWVGAREATDPARVREVMRGATLLTCSTPNLERVGRRYNANVRLIRNSIDVASFVPTLPRPDTPTRVVCYGHGPRLRDYAGEPLTPGERPSYCRAAVEEYDLRRVFLGSDRTKVDAVRRAGFDEAWPTVEWERWPGMLADSHPDIGLAPLIRNPLNSARSELHWLEYTAVGAPCVAERWRGGPFEVVRSGVDGFLAHSRRDWSDAIGKLVRSPQLRAEIAGAARERIERDYNPQERAEEVAEAWRWAAEHPRNRAN